MNIELEDLYDGLILSSGECHKMTIISPKGILACYLYDQDMNGCLAGYSYEIYDEKNKILEGKSDQNGFLIHKGIPVNYYILKVNDEEYIINTVMEDDEPIFIGVLNETNKPVEETMEK